ncbi:MAG: Na+/H+ antiporter NhaC family protein [Bacillota bacterium]|nr:Na+/H+ antiporter NhaC family protein [Bacillota bacterium]
MVLIVAFAVFIAAMVACIATGQSIIFGLVVGFVTFIAAGHIKGFIVKDMLLMAWGSVKDSIIVVEIWLMIGLLTGIWRASGTISFFVYYGVLLVRPPLFIILAFVMCCVLSYILGTSFAVSGTLGVMLMALASSAGVDPLLTGGAIMSGIYFGDRCSPASSSAILVANITGTDLMTNVKRMFATGTLPVGITLIIYAVLSVRNPMNQVDDTIMSALSTEFELTPMTLIPVAFIVILPILRFDIRWAFIGGILSSGVIAVLCQHMSIMESVSCALGGFSPESTVLKEILSGGGLIEMFESCVIVTIACSYSGIFEGTNLLNDIQEIIEKMMNKTGKFIATLILSLMTCAIFCSQTIAAMLCNDLMKKPYEKTGSDNYELAMDIENSTIMVCALFPWCISASVPLTMLGVDARAILYGFLLYIVPICYIFTRRHWYKDKPTQED